MANEEKRQAEEEQELLSTRERITKVALDVFADKGLHGATMVEIAKGAGLTGGALYRYFESKEDIFKAVIEEHSVSLAALDLIRGLIPELEPKTVTTAGVTMTLPVLPLLSCHRMLTVRYRSLNQPKFSTTAVTRSRGTFLSNVTVSMANPSRPIRRLAARGYVIQYPRR